MQNLSDRAVREERWSASTEEDGMDPTVLEGEVSLAETSDRRSDEIQLLAQSVDIRRHQVFQPGVGVEVAIGATDRAERNVEIKRERHGRIVASRSTSPAGACLSVNAKVL